jgi:hypothetical protein
MDCIENEPIMGDIRTHRHEGDLISLLLFFQSKGSRLKIQFVPHRKHEYYVYATNINQLILFRETVTVYCENHTKHRYTLGAECRGL